MDIRAAEAFDAAGIAAIYNDAVETTTAIWNDRTVDAADRAAWIAGRVAAGYPVLVAAEAGRVLGYASYGPFRAFDGYRHTGELSIYVERAARGQGLGKRLLAALIEEARARRLHVLIAAIDASNQGSIGLHLGMGFREAGRLTQVGTKFGRWLDLAFLELMLDPPA